MWTVTKMNTTVLMVGIVCLSFIADAGHCSTGSWDIRELNEDFCIIFVADAITASEIINKYRKKRQSYLPVFEQILTSPEANNEEIKNVIYMLAILQEKAFRKIVADISAPDSVDLSDLNDVKNFYFYRIRYDKDRYFKRLTNRLGILLEKPTDSLLITFLAFFHADDVNFALDYLDKLSSKSDGAVSELIAWSVNYLYLINQNDLQIAKKVKASSSYRKYKK